MTTMRQLPRLLFASAGSGGGKTTVTCAFLRLALDRGLAPAAFKAGPDYIDPMFHSAVLGTPGRNLDLYFSTEEQVKGRLVRYGGTELAVLEGAMGYFDGISGTDQTSAWHLAGVTDTPVILLLSPKGMGLSLAAMARGFRDFREEHRIAGILLNRCGEGMYRTAKPLLEAETGLPVLGYLPEVPGCAIENRHLGLLTAAEVGNLEQKIRTLADTLAETADIDRLLAIAAAAPPISGRLDPMPPVTAATDEKPVIAVGRDRVFCFYYEDNLDLLRELGAELAFFSPLEDAALPERCSALYIGGGYPELNGAALERNVSLREEIRRAVAGGLPTFAECGGFQYLQERLDGPTGERSRMVGAIPSESTPAGRLLRFGYHELTAKRDTLLCGAGERIRAHEFHHWDSRVNGDACTARKPGNGREWVCVVAGPNLFAGYPHLYFDSNPGFAARFVRAAARYREEHHGA